MKTTTRRNRSHLLLKTAMSTLLFLVLQSAVFSQAAGNLTQFPNSSSSLPSPHFEADFTAVIAGGFHTVSWGNGYFVSFGIGELKEPVALYDKFGNWLFTTFPDVGGAVRVYGQDAVPTKSGTVVLAASAMTADGAFVDVIAEIGKQGVPRIIKTTNFYTQRICVTDGKVWAYGHELTSDRKREPRTHFPVLREFSFEKGQLRTALDRATLHPPVGVPLTGSKNDVYLRCGSGKVVVANGATNELIEYDLATSKLYRWPLASFGKGFYMTGAAFTESGELYVSTLRPAPQALARIVRVEVSAVGVAEGKSLATAPAAGGFFLLFGADGNDLVYSQGHRAPTVFWWSTPQSEEGK